MYCIHITYVLYYITYVLINVKEHINIIILYWYVKKCKIYALVYNKCFI
jgi:hypothetical protein